MYKIYQLNRGNGATRMRITSSCIPSTWPLLQYWGMEDIASAPMPPSQGMPISGPDFGVWIESVMIGHSLGYIRSIQSPEYAGCKARGVLA